VHVSILMVRNAAISLGCEQSVIPITFSLTSGVQGREFYNFQITSIESSLTEIFASSLRYAVSTLVLH